MGVWAAVGGQGLELPELTHLAETFSRLVRGIWEMRGTVCKCLCVSVCVWEKEKSCARERDWINFLYCLLCSSPEVTHCLFLKEDSWTLGWHPWPPWFVGIIPLFFDRVCFGQGVFSLAAIQYLRLEIIQYKLFSLDLMKIRSWRVKLFSLDWWRTRGGSGTRYPDLLIHLISRYWSFPLYQHCSGLLDSIPLGVC